MSNYHILKTATNMKTVNAVFHVPIPNANNEVGMNWRTAVIESQGGADNITSVLGNISSDELTALKNGSIYEHVVSVKLGSLNLTNAERLAKVEDTYISTKASIIAEKQITLNFYGYAGDI